MQVSGMLSAAGAVHRNRRTIEVREEQSPAATVETATVEKHDRSHAHIQAGEANRLVGGRRGTRTPDIFLVREAL